MTSKPKSADDGQQTRPFAELLNWHLSRGTRPADSSNASHGTWKLSEFARAVQADERTVRNWRNGKNLPSAVQQVEYALLGKGDDNESLRLDLRNAYEIERKNKNSNKTHQRGKSPLKTRYASRSKINRTIEPLQSYFVETPLFDGSSLFSLSTVIGSYHNKIHPIERIIGNSHGAEFQITLAKNMDDFLNYISLESYELKESILVAIDQKYAVLYQGSIKPLDVQQISRLPVLLKGFAGLSGRQFRVGLFRLSMTIIVMAVTTSVSTYSAWEVAKGCRELTAHVLGSLLHETP